jgi:hypothetical protein
MSLEKEIKKEIGYTEETCPRCDRCKHHTEKENLYVDRMWDSHCSISGIKSISVKPDARCNKFEEK